MGLAFYDEDQTLLTSLSRFRSFHNGYTGASYEGKIYVRNDDSTRWYTNVVISLATTVYDGVGELGISGISFKFIYGERRPTEAEWDIAESGLAITLPNIGDTNLANESTYFPVWVRVYVPGGSSAGIDDSYILRLSYLSRVVGV